MRSRIRKDATWSQYRDHGRLQTATAARSKFSSTLWSGVHGLLPLSDQLFAAPPNIERDIIDILTDQFISAQQHRGRSWP
jgi:hypothetical protein